MTSGEHGSIHTPRVVCSSSQQRTPLKTPCIANLSLAPRSGQSTSQRARPSGPPSFLQASPNNLCCVQPHVFLDRVGQSYTMLSTGHQPQSMFLTCRLRNPAGSLTQVSCATPNAHPRPSGDMAACSLQAFVHLPLNQVFRPHDSGIFDSRHFQDGQLSAGHRLLHPQDLGMEVSHSSRSAPRGNRLRRRGVLSFA